MVSPPSAPPAPPLRLPAGAPRRPRRTTVAWLAALTLVSGVAIVGWLRPTQDHEHSGSSAPTYTDQQVAEAKTAVCTAFGNVEHALNLADARNNGSSDPTAQLAVETSTRQVLDAGSRYLLAKLAEEPATPRELAAAIRTQANAYQDVVIGYLDGLNYSDPVLKSAGSTSNEATDTIHGLCK